MDSPPKLCSSQHISMLAASALLQPATGLALCTATGASTCPAGAQRVWYTSYLFSQALASALNNAQLFSRSLRRVQEAFSRAPVIQHTDVRSKRYCLLLVRKSHKSSRTVTIQKISPHRIRSNDATRDISSKVDTARPARSRHIWPATWLLENTAKVRRQWICGSSRSCGCSL